MCENYRVETLNNEVRTNYIDKLAKKWDESTDSTKVKLTEFIKYVPKNSLIDFLARYELYNLIKDVPGDIWELGVCGGKGLFTFVQSVFINEPQYEWRNIVGFDTFDGFVSVHEKDNLNNCSNLKKKGAFKYDKYDDLIDLKNIHEDYRYLKRREQIKLVKGDIMKTIPEYLSENGGTIISLLYLDLDLYEPTKFAIKKLWNKIPKGGIIAFDEAIMKEWEGEAIALNEVLGFSNHKLKRLPNVRAIYIIKE